MSVACFSRTLHTLNSWASGVQNSDDLHVEHYWEYLATDMEPPGNLYNIKQILRAVTWGSIRTAYSEIADGHIFSKHYIQRCIFCAENVLATLRMPSG